MKLLTEIKPCLECGDPVRGRSDKKFCSDQCRVAYNNRNHCNETNYMRSVTQALRKNRRILVDLNTQGKTHVTRQKLAFRGFDFNYFTDTYTTKDGAMYYYCYEQGYLPIDKDHCLLVIKTGLES